MRETLETSDPRRIVVGVRRLGAASTQDTIIGAAASRVDLASTDSKAERVSARAAATARLSMIAVVDPGQ